MLVFLVLILRGDLVLTPASESSRTSTCLKSCINHVARINEGLCDHTTKVGCICSSPRPNVVRNQVVSCMQNCPSVEPKDVYLGVIAYNDICKSLLNEQNSQSGDVAIEAFNIDNVEHHVRAGEEFNLSQLKKKRQDPPNPESPGPDPEVPTTTSMEIIGSTPPGNTSGGTTAPPIDSTPGVSPPGETPDVTTPGSTPGETPGVTTPGGTTPGETPGVTTPGGTTPGENPWCHYSWWHHSW